MLAWHGDLWQQWLVARLCHCPGVLVPARIDLGSKPAFDLAKPVGVPLKGVDQKTSSYGRVGLEGFQVGDGIAAEDRGLVLPRAVEADRLGRDGRTADFGQAKDSRGATGSASTETLAVARRARDGDSFCHGDCL